MRSAKFSTRPFLLAGSFLLLALGFAQPGLGAGRGEPGPALPVRIALGDEDADLALLHTLDVDVDGVFDGWARAYVIQEEWVKLRGLGFSVTALPDEGKIGLARMKEEGVAPGVRGGVPAQYHTYETLTAELQALAAARPDITRLFNVGSTLQGRQLWVMKVTDNPATEEDEPEVAYVSSMHGDEVVGKELCVNLLHHLTDNYGVDARVTDLVDQTEIWIMPSMNPDGTALGQRWNAHNVDLNRDFPDQFTDPDNTTAGREPETIAVMNWRKAHSINLSSNFHGGAVVANYPWDSNPQSSATYSPSPDDSTFISLARTFADNNPVMATSNGHPAWDNGITNGADWYPITGGMQDWGYIWHGGMEVLVELSQAKWPPASQLPAFWDQNLESLLSYFERVHEGIRGVVTRAVAGTPLAATIAVVGNPYPSYTDPQRGDFHRVMQPGSYRIEISALGYSTRVIEVVVPPGPAARYDVVLEPLAVELQPAGACADDGGGCQPWLAAGGSFDLAVTLRNLGLAATSVRAELEPTGWFAGVTRATALYPNLLPGQSGQSLAPHHGVSIAPAVPAGHKVGFALRWSADQGSGQSEPIFLEVGAEQCTSVAATDLPRSIVDHQTAISTLNFIPDREISQVRVTVDVQHTYIGELRLELVSPTGRPLALHNHSGGSADDIVGTYGVGLTPFEPLSRLVGDGSSGTWQLRVHDGVTGDQGTLASWSLEACGHPFEAAAPEMRFRDLSVEPGGVRLNWWPYPGLSGYRVYRSTDPASAASFVEVTAEETDSSDTTFLDSSNAPMLFWLITGVGPNGEGPWGHFGR